MKNILEQICRTKRDEVSERLVHIVGEQLKPGKNDQRQPKNFANALLGNGLSVIAEVKKASPSKGIIRQDFDPVEIATAYEKNGAACISVLTDEKYFQGHNDYLKLIRASVSLPLLRKEFIIDAKQIRESYDLGADAILLIVAILDDSQLVDFIHLATEFGLTCLVEVHTENELYRAIHCGATLIGINNRNLNTFKTDIRTSLQLKEKIPSGITTVSESGIRNAQDCKLLLDHGFNAILVGETLMREKEPGEAIHRILGV